MPRLSLYLLGTPQIEHGSAPVRLSQRKPLALFAYLGVTAAPHTRDHLATLLWPDAQSDRALAYLRNALWQLNQTPIGEWIDVERDLLALRSAPDLTIDVVRFHEQLASTDRHGHTSSVVCPDCIAPLTEAVDLYRGDFMAGFSLQDSAAFDEWQFFQAQQLHQKVTDALQKLTHYHGERSREELLLAIDYARRWLALDPVDEAAHRELIKLYALTDQRAAALRQYETCVRALMDEIRVGPSKATVDLYRQVRSGSLASIGALPPDTDTPPTVVHVIEPHPQSRPALPTPPTPFVGRREELTEVCRLLEQPTCRLLSLVGAGGIGKTRLALEAAQRTSLRSTEDRPDGVVFIPLNGISTVAAAIAAIGECLNPQLVRPYLAHLDAAQPLTTLSRAGRPPEEELLDYLRPKQLLMVLDNLEQLIVTPAGESTTPRIVGLIDTILQTAPGVQLLITTRERLALRSEWVYTVTGMTRPTGDVATYESFGAIQLFIQSARRAVIGFDPTPDDLNSIARICRRVEGFPLAIELAASWTKILSCQDIAEEVMASFDFLSTTLRDVPERHRSLRTIFEHTWTLLPEEERGPLSKLAVFRAGFTREAAREIAGASLMTLSALMDRSILHESGSEATRNQLGRRYELHEMLRQYAEEKLRATPDAYRETCEGHSRYYLGWLSSLEAALKGAEQRQTLELLNREVENVRAAWEWAADHGMFSALQQAFFSLILFFESSDRYTEAMRLLASTARAIGSEEEDGKPRYLLGLIHAGEGRILSSLNRYGEAETALLKALALLEPAGESAGLAYALSQAAFAVPGTRQTRMERLERSLAFYERRGDAYGQAEALTGLAQLVADRGDDYRASETYLVQALSLNRQLGSAWGTAEDLMLFGTLAECRGDRSLAREHYGEALALFRELGNLRGISAALFSAADVERKLGEYPAARKMFSEAAALAQEIGHHQLNAMAVQRIGLLAFEVGDYTTAESAVREAKEALPNREGFDSLVRVLDSELGIIAVARGDIATAREYLGRGDPHNQWNEIALGRLAVLTGDATAARTHFGRAIASSLAANGFAAETQRAAIPLVLICLADLETKEGHFSSAAVLLASALEHPLIHHHMRVQAQALLDILRDTLTPDVLSAAMAEGSARDPEALAARVLANEMGAHTASL